MSMRSKHHFLQNLCQSRWISTLKSATIHSMMASNKQSFGMCWVHWQNSSGSKSWIAKYCQCNWGDTIQPLYKRRNKTCHDCFREWINDDMVCNVTNVTWTYLPYFVITIELPVGSGICAPTCKHQNPLSKLKCFIESFAGRCPKPDSRHTKHGHVVLKANCHATTFYLRQWVQPSTEQHDTANCQEHRKSDCLDQPPISWIPSDVVLTMGTCEHASCQLLPGHIRDECYEHDVKFMTYAKWKVKTLD